MKASQFSDAQKAFILKQGVEGHPVAATANSTFEWREVGAQVSIDQRGYGHLAPPGL